MLTLVAFHAFLVLKVDATILEVGIGGAYDSTNIVPKPIVTGITALGLDHVNVLGKTLPEIAWQKAGIYKEGVPALTVNQPEEGLNVIRRMAAEREASSFAVIPRMPDLENLKLGLAGAHQYQNAGLAVTLANTFLQSQANVVPKSSLTEAYIQGLAKTRWPGRCQTVPDPIHPRTTWFLDGAHTHDSLDCCMQWFVSPDEVLRPKKEPSRRVLLFNCTSGRSGPAFLTNMLAKANSQLRVHGHDETSDGFFHHVIFCTNVTYVNGGFKGDLTTYAVSDFDLSHLTVQNELAAAWPSMAPSFPSSNIHVLPSIEHAIGVVRNLEKQDCDMSLDVLVTGSLHLVGGVIEVAGLSDVAL